ncbi:MAG: hypothetical protein V1921_00495 [Candidatus Altiarchaeota archaeon]
MVTKQITESPGEFPPLMEFTASTKFGQLFKPVIDQLVALPKNQRDENIATFRILWNFFGNKKNLSDLAKVEFTREDLIFLLADNVGDILRRPVLDLYLAQRIDESTIAKGENEKGVKGLFLSYISGSAWSRFVKDENLRKQIMQERPDAKVWVDMHQTHENLMNLMEKPENRIFSVGFLGHAAQIAQADTDRYVPIVSDDYDSESRAAKANGRKSRFYTDPGHAFKLKPTIDLMSSAAKMSLGIFSGTRIPPLVKEASFMLVEDNPFHTTWADGLNHCRGLKRYAPLEIDLPEDSITRKSECKGYYASGERALKVIEDKVNTGEKPPDVILSDIELEGGMNGIELTKELHRRYPKAIILMIYSSNPQPYSEEIDKLTRKGIIVGSWNKTTFSPKDMIAAINGKLIAGEGAQHP